jgi:hypothetical protein
MIVRSVNGLARAWLFTKSPLVERHVRRLGFSLEVKSIHKQQTTIRKPIECAPEASSLLSSGGRESMEMAEGDPSRGDTS